MKCKSVKAETAQKRGILWGQCPKAGEGKRDFMSSHDMRNISSITFFQTQGAYMVTLNTDHCFVPRVCSSVCTKWDTIHVNNNGADIMIKFIIRFNTGMNKASRARGCFFFF